MKRKILYSFIAMLLIFPALMMAQKVAAGKAESLSEQEAVVQKCLDLASLQRYYAVNKEGNHQQIVILQFPFAFPAGLSVTKFGQPVLLTDRPNIGNPDAFVNFTSFSVIADKASASFNITYNRNAENPGSIKINMELEKTAKGWDIINSNSNN